MFCLGKLLLERQVEPGILLPPASLLVNCGPLAPSADQQDFLRGLLGTDEVQGESHRCEFVCLLYPEWFLPGQRWGSESGYRKQKQCCAERNGFLGTQYQIRGIPLLRLPDSSSPLLGNPGELRETHFH